MDFRREGGQGRRRLRHVPDGDRLLLFQLLFDRRNYLRGVRSDRRSKSLHDTTVAGDKKFGEIPLDLTRDRRVGLFRQVLVKRCLVITLY
jgi:hypothetical protein